MGKHSMQSVQNILELQMSIENGEEMTFSSLMGIINYNREISFVC